MRLTRSSGQFQVKSAYQKTVCFPGTSCRFSLVNKASSTLAVCVCVIRDPGPHAHSTGVSQAVACHPLWEVLEPLSSSLQLPAIFKDLTGHQPMICSWLQKGRRGEIPLCPHQGLLVLWGKGLWRRVRESLCVDEICALQGSGPPLSPEVSSSTVLLS